jgi:hypothetical protein
MKMWGHWGEKRFVIGNYVTFFCAIYEAKNNFLRDSPVSD